MNTPKPFKHQLEANTKLNPLDYCALFADMGTGKSRIAIDWMLDKLARYGSDRVVIIAPSVVATQWHEEQLPTHCDVHYKSHVYKSKKTKKYLRALDSFIMSAKHKTGLYILCIHYEVFASPRGREVVNQLLATSKSRPVIILDESSRAKNPAAKSVKAIVKLRTLYPDSFRMIMSGTPASKSPVDLWSQFDFLTHNYFGCGYVAFSSMYAVKMGRKLRVKGRLISIETPLDKATYDKLKLIISRNTKDGILHPEVPHMVYTKFDIAEADFWFVFHSEEFHRFKNLDVLKDNLAPVTYAVKRADCVDLPPKIYQRIPCKLNTEQRRLIKDLIKYSATVYNGEMLTVDIKALIGLRVLQICGGNFSHITDIEGNFSTTPIKGVNSKLNYLAQDLQEIGDQQFIVCAVFTAEVLAIEAKITPLAEIGVLHGKTTPDERKRVVEEFKSGAIQGLVMNPSVGGYGLNLQNATVQYWYSRNYRTDVRLQAEDRLHRIGTIQSPVYKDLLSDVKFEQEVLEVLQEGKDINDVFVNNSVNEVFKM